MIQGTGKYDFSVREAGDTTRYVSLAILPVDDIASRYFQTVWHKLATAVISFHDHCGDNACPKWTTWQVGKWSKESVTPIRSRFAAWHGDLLAGFVNLRSEFQSSFTKGTPITYLEHLAASPGCLTTRIWNRSLVRVGQALLAFAIYQSIENGHRGAIGLHAADETSEDWYEKLNTKYGGRLFHKCRIGVNGFYERSLQRPYYEATVDGAIELLESYRS